MAKLSGTINPIGDKIMIYNMEFGSEKTLGGIILHSDNGKSSGIHPRWAQVFAVGPLQTDVKVGEWILIDHARWTRSIRYTTESGDEIDIRLADNKAILLKSDTKPEDVQRVSFGALALNF